MKKWAIQAATVVAADKKLKEAAVVIADGIIGKTGRGVADDIDIVLDAGSVVAVPGLINAHDHLLGTYFPKVGNGPYENWLPWDNDLKSSPLYQERQQIENRDLYLLGAYRNLVSGVTTVADHIPHFVSEPFAEILPVKTIRDYGMAHSLGQLALAWGGDIASEYRKSEENNLPFITHIAEGFDNETKQNLQMLKKAGGLGPNSVLIHGIAFSPSDMDEIKKAGASVVWCGDSNMFMFNHTTNIGLLLEKGINVCIGTDSPMSGGLNILEEARFDRKLFKKLTGKELPDSKILQMITENPAHALKLDGAGALKEGNVADLALFRDKGGSPESSVVDAGLRDVMLVVIDGNPVYGDASYAGLFDALGIKYQNIVLDDAEKIVAGDIIGLLKRISRAVGFKKTFPFLPVEFNI